MTRFLNYRVGLSAALIVFVSMLTGCGSARRSEPLKGSVPVRTAKIERGRDVFMAKCQMCHPGGEAGLGPALNDKPLPEFLMKTQVRVGLGAMPSFSHQEITDPDLDAVIAYLKEIRRRDAKPE